MIERYGHIRHKLSVFYLQVTPADLMEKYKLQPKLPMEDSLPVVLFCYTLDRLLVP